MIFMSQQRSQSVEKFSMRNIIPMIEAPSDNTEI